LAQLEQDSETKFLDFTAASLAQSKFIKAKDKDIRLLTSCCLADIIRLYAPDAPYDQQQLLVIYFFYFIFILFYSYFIFVLFYCI
jgi:sister-chromatid-cohesion protein PDS5